MGLTTQGLVWPGIATPTAGAVPTSWAEQWPRSYSRKDPAGRWMLTMPVLQTLLRPCSIRLFLEHPQHPSHQRCILGKLWLAWQHIILCTSFPSLPSFFPSVLLPWESSPQYKALPHQLLPPALLSREPRPGLGVRTQGKCARPWAPLKLPPEQPFLHPFCALE